MAITLRCKLELTPFVFNFYNACTILKTWKQQIITFESYPHLLLSRLRGEMFTNFPSLLSSHLVPSFEPLDLNL